MEIIPGKKRGEGADLKNKKPGTYKTSRSQIFKTPVKDESQGKGEKKQCKTSVATALS